MKWQEKAAPYQRQQRLDPDAASSSSARVIFAAEPPFDAAMAICLRAWSELDTTRSTTSVIVPKGMGAFTTHIIHGPISWTAAIQWCRFQRLDRDATEIVLSVLRRLDRDRAERDQSRLNK